MKKKRPPSPRFTAAALAVVSVLAPLLHQPTAKATETPTINNTKIVKNTSAEHTRQPTFQIVDLSTVKDFTIEKAVPAGAATPQIQVKIDYFDGLATIGYTSENKQAQFDCAYDQYDNSDKWGLSSTNLVTHNSDITALLMLNNEHEIFAGDGVIPPTCEINGKACSSKELGDRTEAMKDVCKEIFISLTTEEALIIPLLPEVTTTKDFGPAPRVATTQEKTLSKDAATRKLYTLLP